MAKSGTQFSESGRRTSRDSARRLLDEATGFVAWVVAIGILLSLFSFDPSDPSWNVAARPHRPANLIGVVGAHLADVLLQSFGLVAFLLPVFLITIGWMKLRGRSIQGLLSRSLGWFACCLSLAAGLGLSFPEVFWRQDVRLGGFTGLLIATGLSSILNTVGAALVLVTAFILTVIVAANVSVVEQVEKLQRHIASWIARLKTYRSSRLERKAALRRNKVVPEGPSRVEQKKAQPPIVRTDTEAVSGMVSAAKMAGQPASPPAGSLPPVVRQSPVDGALDHATHAGEQMNAGERSAAATSGEGSLSPEVREMLSTASVKKAKSEKKAVRIVGRAAKSPRAQLSMPPIDLLNMPDRIASSSDEDKEELMQRAQQLAERCSEFAVTGHVHQISPGPVVTTFEFKPDPGVKYSRITSLVDDLCLALEAESIRIDRIPGKSTVGIEVPNRQPELIYLRGIIESHKFQKARSRLTIALGKTIDGGIYVSDLTKMPHLLIAGATGTGKSMTINSIIVSLLYRVTPEEVRFILIDPKRLELGLYDGLPHLLTPILMEPKRAANALKWAVREMEHRYRLLANLGVRNIEQYNREVKGSGRRSLVLEGEGIVELEPLPYVVIIIDELADLMMAAASDVEASITRLAQMARAVGIHLILATQRPSVDVITGLIKANFSSRIAFRVSSKVDSRTIVDMNGAEQLLGRGDMLFLPPGTSRLIRVHGAFVEEKEINAVVEFLKSQAAPDYDESVILSDKEREVQLVEEGLLHHDDLYEEALKIVVQIGKASTSALQRRLRIGYGRAASIIDMMEREGLVEPPNGTRPRAITQEAREFYERLKQVEEEPR